MKFTKQEAIEKIKANFSKKVEKIDKWERTIKETVDTMCDLVGDESEIELDTFAEKVEKQLMTQKGHIDKEASSVASDLQNQIEDLKKKLPKDTKSKKKKDDDNDNEPDDELSQLKERLKKLEDEQQAEKTKKTISQKVDELAAEIEKKGVKNKKWIKSMLEKAKIDENTDIEKEADSYLEMYNEFFSELPDDDVTPREAGKATRLERIKEVVKKAGEARKQDGI
jgi:hypothetical protein